MKLRRRDRRRRRHARLRGRRAPTILDWIVDRTTAAALRDRRRASARRVRLTAEYTSNRKQFDQPIAMFQAVGQRMADSYIDNEAVKLTMWQAATPPRRG